MPGLDCQALRAIVVDLDAKKDGIKHFKALCRERRIDVGDCPIVKTPTGGIHLLFADPKGRWRNSTSKLAPGVDTRGVGGYAVAAGALRCGFGVYEPVRPAALAEFIDVIASGRLAPPPKPLADLLDAHCLARTLAPRGAIRRPPTTVLAGVAEVAPLVNTAAMSALTQSALLAGNPGDWDDLSAGLSERWTLEGALAAVAAAVPGTRNDTFAREAFTSGLRAQALGLDPVQTVEALIEAALRAASADTKTVDTITRCFEAGMRHADEEAAAAAGATAALSPATAAASSTGETAGSTAAYETAALKAAKTRLHDAFRIARMLGRHRIRDDLVRKALAVGDIRVRAKLMFTLAAFLLKSDHSWGEIVDAVVACGFLRATGVAAFVWAQKHVAKG
jgi:Bifunctional DNA primase/polymerase, N-terminal